MRVNNNRPFQEENKNDRDLSPFLEKKQHHTFRTGFRNESTFEKFDNKSSIDKVYIIINSFQQFPLGYHF